MQKIILVFTAFLTNQTILAQTDQGQWLLGGSISYTNESVSGSSGSSSTFQIAPNAGYFIREDLAVGGLFDFSSQSSSGSSSSQSDFIFAPFARYYFTPIGDHAKLFGQFSFGFGSQSSGGSSTSLTRWELKAGPAFFLTKNVALEATLFYNSFSVSGSSASRNTFGIGAGFQIHL